MKTKKIYDMCKRTESVVVEQTEDGRQFINCDGNRYLIEGMPEIQWKQFLSFLDVPYKNRDSWNVYEGRADETMCADALETDEELELFPFSLNYGGNTYIPFIRNDGIVIMIDEDQLSPLSCENLTMLLRKLPTGEQYIIVKEGMYLFAVLKFKVASEIIDCREFMKHANAIAFCCEMKTREDGTDEDVVGKLKELYE